LRTDRRRGEELRKRALCKPLSSQLEYIEKTRKTPKNPEKPRKTKYYRDLKGGNITAVFCPVNLGTNNRHGPGTTGRESALAIL
jgi:hypothetical protein